MTVRVLILGEGITDVGGYEYNGQWENGCIINLLDKVNEQLKPIYVPIDKRNLPKTLPMKGKRKFEGHGKNVQKMIIHAQLKGIQYNVIVYYGDTDKDAGTKNTDLQARRSNEKAYGQTYDAFEFFDKKGIAVIPLRMLESWLLSDENAFLKAFGQRIKLPRKPENLWGDWHDPNSNHPKRFLQRILDGMGLSGDRQTFCDLVDCMEIEALESRCPVSVPPFLQKAREYFV